MVEPTNNIDLHADSVVLPDPAVHERVLGGRVVLLDTRDASLHTMNPTGGLIWLSLEPDQSLGAICEEIAAEVGQDPELILSEASAFLRSLLDSDLATVVG